MTEEKQKVIGVLKSLIEFLEDDGGDSSRPDTLRMTAQAAGAEEARIMTQDEIIGWDGYVWNEYKGIKSMQGALLDHGMERGNPFIGDFPTKDYLWDGYKKLWRVWTGLPTEAQRKAEAWEE